MTCPNRRGPINTNQRSAHIRRSRSNTPQHLLAQGHKALLQARFPPVPELLGANPSISMKFPFDMQSKACHNSVNSSIDLIVNAVGPGWTYVLSVLLQAHVCMVCILMIWLAVWFGPRYHADWLVTSRLDYHDGVWCMQKGGYGRVRVECILQYFGDFN